MLHFFRLNITKQPANQSTFLPLAASTAFLIFFPASTRTRIVAASLDSNCIFRGLFALIAALIFS